VIRFRRRLLGILAGILIAISLTTLGIFVGRRTQQAAAAQPHR
jgi:hypothetical protein